MKIFNAAVIGYGYSGRSFHSYLIGLEPGLRLHGIAVRDPQLRQQAAAERQCATYASFEEAIADRMVDLIVLATPNDTHAGLAIRALEAGKHVVTDKIMCLTLAECEAMISASQASGKMLSVFHNRRWDGDFLTLRRLLAEGRLGDLRWLEMAWQGFRPMRRWRALRHAGGGRFFDLGAHLLDQTLLLIPHTVTSVYCRLHYDHPGTDTESHALLVLGFSNGATACLDTGSMHALGKPRFYATGTGGAFVKYGLDPQEAALQNGAIETATEAPESYGRYEDGNGPVSIPTLPGRWTTYYATIAAQLSGRKTAETSVSLTEMWRLMAVYDAALSSARTGEVVKTSISPLGSFPQSV